MKCQFCGGSVIFEQGCFGSPDRLKCVACGREPRQAKGDCEMEEKMKACTKCNKEFPATNEYFSRNKATKDGLEYWCKDCRKKKQKEYQDRKTGKESRQTRPIEKRSPKRNPRVSPVSDPIIKASPAEIVIVLRKGIALEMIQRIGEQYGLKVTVEST